MVYCVTAVECSPATVKTVAFVILVYVINKLMGFMLMQEPIGSWLMLGTAASLGQGWKKKSARDNLDEVNLIFLGLIYFEPVSTFLCSEDGTVDES